MNRPYFHETTEVRDQVNGEDKNKKFDRSFSNS